MNKLIGIIFVLLFSHGALAEDKTSDTQIELHTFWLTEGEKNALRSLTNRMSALDVNANIVWYEQYNALRHAISNRIGLGYPPEMTHWVGGEGLERLVTNKSTYMSPNFSDRAILRETIHPEVIEEVSVNGDIYGLPVGIHLQSSTIYNMDVLAKVGVTEIPKKWEDLYALFEKLKKASILPYAGTSELWVNRELFNGILVSIGKRIALDDLYGDFDPNGTLMPQLVEAMKHFTYFRNFLDNKADGRAWFDMVQLVIDDKAAMTVIGDYAWAEINTKGTGDLNRYKCSSLPGHQSAYFGVDMFVAFETSLPGWRKLYNNMLEIILSSEAQYEYLRHKGGVSVVKGIDPKGLSPCGKESFKRWNLDPKERFSTPGGRDKNSTALVNSALMKITADKNIKALEAADILYKTVKEGLSIK